MAKLEKLGSLWKRKSNKTGETFLTGKIGDFDVIVFVNKGKKESKHPDFEVYKGEPKNGQQQQKPPSDSFDF